MAQAETLGADARDKQLSHCHFTGASIFFPLSIFSFALAFVFVCHLWKHSLFRWLAALWIIYAHSALLVHAR